MVPNAQDPNDDAPLYGILKHHNVSIKMPPHWPYAWPISVSLFAIAVNGRDADVTQSIFDVPCLECPFKADYYELRFKAMRVGRTADGKPVRFLFYRTQIDASAAHDPVFQFRFGLLPRRPPDSAAPAAAASSGIPSIKATDKVPASAATQDQLAQWLHTHKPTLGALHTHTHTPF